MRRVQTNLRIHKHQNKVRYIATDLIYINNMTEMGDYGTSQSGTVWRTSYNAGHDGIK